MKQTRLAAGLAAIIVVPPMQPAHAFTADDLERSPPLVGWPRSSWPNALTSQ